MIQKLKCEAICSDEDFAQCITVTTRIPSLPDWEGFLSKIIDVYKEDKLWNTDSDCRSTGIFGKDI